MPLNIKNREVERLVDEVSRLAGETKTEVVRKALIERRSHLALRARPLARGARLQRFLETEVWPSIPQMRRLAKRDEEAILGYGREGV
ncbi:MAG: type II toxin-antitoxin system VapB family antitoxin [Acidobacteria bacterium]|nr:type II toxin-antitoxin system VapB family antitoxin [Acidobacteriota bacterium]